jgi:hypothetical protein
MGAAYGQRGEMSRARGGGKASGWEAGAAMSVDRAAQFGSMVHAAAKALRAKVKAGGRYRPPDRLHAPSPLLKSHHTASIYHGMVRVRKPYRNPRKTTVQSQYLTWRTISDRTGVGWIHPGIEPRRLSDRVGIHAAKVMSQAVTMAYERAIGGAK